MKAPDPQDHCSNSTEYTADKDEDEEDPELNFLEQQLLLESYLSVMQDNLANIVPLHEKREEFLNEFGGFAMTAMTKSLKSDRAKEVVNHDAARLRATMHRQLDRMVP